ncbi:MAG: hypothetical protein HQK50_01865 [Oligoflexia bacterium]|nr:hypothetical protein [Oligoflexia bacterium]MBF0364284.1 hypothetical protein [Oligoflexia bacterium]
MNMKTLLMVSLVGAFSVMGLTLSSAFSEESKNKGIGLIIGEPTGISLNYRLSAANAIDGAIAWSFVDDNKFHLHADYLFSKKDLLNIDKVKLDVYFGGGVRFKDEKQSLLGVRIPVGVSYFFKQQPIDIFLELAPILDLIPSSDISFNAAIGARYYFN